MREPFKDLWNGPLALCVFGEEDTEARSDCKESQALRGLGYVDISARRSMEYGPVPPDRKGIRKIHIQGAEQGFRPLYREIND